MFLNIEITGSIASDDSEMEPFSVYLPKKKIEQYILQAPVLRSSRDFEHDGYLPVPNSVALLNSLAGTLIAVRVEAYSATREDALGKPFIVQAEAPRSIIGQNLARTISREQTRKRASFGRAARGARSDN